MLFAVAWLATVPVPLPAPVHVLPPRQFSMVTDPVNGFRPSVAAATKVALPLELVDDERARGRFLAAALNGESMPALAASAAAKNQGALVALHAALEMPGFQTLPPLAKGVPPPRLGPLVLLGELGAVDARLRLREGDVSGGLARGLDMLRLGRKLVYEVGGTPTTILAGAKIEQAALSALGRELARIGAAPSAELATFASSLEGLVGTRRPLEELEATQRDYALPLLHGLAGENLDQVMDILAIDITGEVKAIYDRHITRVATRDFAGLRDELALEGARNRTDPSTWFGLRPMLASVLHPYTGIPDVILQRCAPQNRLVLTPLLAEARLEGLRVGVAIARYRHDHGALPARPLDLVPAYVAAFPADPFRPSQPLGYAAGRVWSVGCAGPDQAGRLVVTPVDEELALLQAPGDLVLLPWPPQEHY
jgi:hypothetical protein